MTGARAVRPRAARRFAIGWNTRCSELYDQSWLDYYYEDLVSNCSATQTSDLKPTDQEIPWTTMFALSYHWAMATMSSLPYGDGPTAQTALEYMFGVTCQVIGAIFSNVAAIIQAKDGPGSQFQVRPRSRRKLAVARPLLCVCWRRQTHARCRSGCAEAKPPCARLLAAEAEPHQPLHQVLPHPTFDE
jgi:hypothetical protein